MSNDQSLQKVEFEKLCFENCCTIKAIKKLNSQENLSLWDKFFSMNLDKKTEEIGEIGYDFSNHTSKKIGYIHHLNVDKGYRRIGIDTLLFKEALQDLQDKRCENVHWCSSEMGVPFYLKNGAMNRKKNKFLCVHPMKIYLREHTLKQKLTKFVNHTNHQFHLNNLFE
jgi:GNAT superfamily N-acetyltransferase